MTRRWICFVTGWHRWTTQASDEGERYRRCRRCQATRWDGGVDRAAPNHPPIGQGFGGGGIG
jgi:hypothetical protein